MLRYIFFPILLIIAAVTVASVANADEVNPIPAAYQITTMDVESAVANALEGEGVAEKLKVDVLGARAAILHEGSTPITPKLTGLTYDKRSERWNANLLIVADNKVETVTPLSGRYHEVVEIPMLKHPIRKGSLITAEDIDMMDYRLSRTRDDVIRDPEALVGLSPRTVISPKRPIRAREIVKPGMLKKNSMVKIIYSNGPMEIVANGQAMQDGSKNEMIEVRNLASRNLIQAQVKDAQTVIITPRSHNQELASNGVF